MTSSFNPGAGITGESLQFGASGVTLTDTYNGELLQATASGGVISFTAPTSASQAKWLSVDPNSFTYSVNAASAPGTGVTAVWASGGTPSYSTAVPDAFWCVPVYGLGYWIVFPSAQVLSGYQPIQENVYTNVSATGTITLKDPVATGYTMELYEVPNSGTVTFDDSAATVGSHCLTQISTGTGTTVTLPNTSGVDRWTAGTTAGTPPTIGASEVWNLTRTCTDGTHWDWVAARLA